RNWHLPGTDHLVAATQPAHRAVSDRNEEVLARNRGMAQYAVDRLAQLYAHEIHLVMVALQALDVARHARRLAQDDVDGNIDRTRRPCRRWGQRFRDPRQTFAEGHPQLAVFGGHADYRVGTTLAA